MFLGMLGGGHRAKLLLERPVLHLVTVSTTLSLGAVGRSMWFRLMMQRGMLVLLSVLTTWVNLADGWSSWQRLVMTSVDVRLLWTAVRVRLSVGCAWLPLRNLLSILQLSLVVRYR